MCDTKSSTRQKKLMDFELAEKSIKEMKAVGINSILLHTIGDPLANTKLKDYLYILRKYKIQAGISTNGLMLEKHLDTLKEYFDICSNIRFSIDGVKKNTYEKIRYGGKFENVIRNLDLAQNQLKPIGYEFAIDLVISKDNFNELGEFIVFFKKYLNNPFKNMHLNFMNSLSPNNDYFLNNNVMPENTYENIFCNFASQLTPYILVDGRVSACCRDYDGSLVVDDINQNSLGDIYKSEGFKNLHNAHINDDGSIEEYKLCKSCFVVDARINRIWNNTVALILYNFPNKDAKFYQLILNELILNLKNLDASSFNGFLNKFYLNK